uniref:Uncharacterized protein n=1 Tax=Anguilla anguilla TaxID=7936 RepID=A0A0E9PYP6_ANGAN
MAKNYRKHVHVNMINVKNNPNLNRGLQSWHSHLWLEICCSKTFTVLRVAAKINLL